MPFRRGPLNVVVELAGTDGSGLVVPFSALTQCPLGHQWRVYKIAVIQSSGGKNGPLSITVDTLLYAGGLSSAVGVTDLTNPMQVQSGSNVIIMGTGQTNWNIIVQLLGDDYINEYL